ncbi:AAA family ATPase [Dactylosporangium sp. NPDC049140]|uniref:NACHT domain-containing protein n=1 Tax=Dactylosporangium sp. NPDC049140 TaxID=3155647 RepID=UPI0033C0B876
MTFRGALQILGRDDPPWLKRLDVLLGGAVVAAGVAGAAWGAPLFGAAVLGGLWASVDQKNEVMALLRGGIDKLAGRLAATALYERAELIAAAHTTIVAASYFEVLHERLDEAGLGGFRVLDAEMKSLASGGRAAGGGATLERTLAMTVPAPSAATGFWENRQAVAAWYGELGEAVRSFLTGLSGGPAAAAVIDKDIAAAAGARYVSRYLELAARVPEFQVWASLDEHAATRQAVRDLRTAADEAFAGQTEAFARFERLLTLMSAAIEGWPDLVARLRRINRVVLDQPVFRAQPGAGSGGVRFPLVRDIHLNPRYRICRFVRGQSRPADEQWWAHLPPRPELDLCLASYFVSAEATRRPLLLLGHPGAGKSLLTKVLAARLPPNAYTVVRVPLRSVNAHGRVLAQIQEALAAATNDAVHWRPLVEQSRGSVLVVLLDGLDELLQATPDDRTGYLEDVIAFQETEANLGAPVAVVVTSRTVVADRVDIPADTVVIKLEDFDDEQVGYWLDAWARANAEGVASGGVRALGLASALDRPELARQPLLLLMLALYAADPQAPELEAGVSRTELYRRLLDVFARREIGNRAAPPAPHELEAAVRAQLDRLSVAALAMFNRGRQHVTGAELAADLVSLGLAEREVPNDTLPGRRLLGEFFFVHVAEAQARDEQRRAYEFLHATFGEYLVARRVVNLLAETAEQTFAGSYGRREPDDALLFALLSHESLAVRKPILHFVRDLFAGLPARERAWTPQLLDLLFARYRRRGSGVRYADYRPVAVDHVREMAAYSANLVLLRTTLADPPGAAVAFPSWNSTVTLWKAALDAGAWLATISVLCARDDGVCALFEQPELPVDVAHARLLGDRRLERTLRYGLALTEDIHYPDPGDAWLDTVVTAVLPDLVWDSGRPHRADWLLPDPVGDVPDEDVRTALSVIRRRVEIAELPVGLEGAENLVQWVARHSSDPQDLAVFALWMRNSVVRDDMPQLRDPLIYADDFVAWALARYFAGRGTSKDDAPEAHALDTVETRLPDEWKGVEPGLLAEIIAQTALSHTPRGRVNRR